MILNAYSVLDAFVVVLRIATSLIVVGLGVSACAGVVRGHSFATSERGQERLHWLLSSSGLLLGLNLASWPLLYLLLQSYVPEWPGVMCIYGVTRIGTGSDSASQYLPGLLAFLQFAKPLTVFLSGAWVVVYRLSRLTRTARYAAAVAAIQTGVGLVGLADASAEAAYLAIPKTEQRLYSGCCTSAFEPSAVEATTSEPIGEAEQFWLSAAHWSVYAVLVWLGSVYAKRAAAGNAPAVLPLALGAVASLGLGAAYLVEVAAPTVLHLPYHRCPYDLAPSAPDVLVAIVLYVAGAFFYGWAYLASRLAAPEALAEAKARQVRELIALGRNAYLAAGSMVVIALVLA